MNTPIYLDYSATTPLRRQVREAMEPYLGDMFGNPSSVHSLGQSARAAVEEARRRLRDVLGGDGGRLAFTGSGSEADNLAVLGFARAHPEGCVVRSSIEHKAVIRSADALAAAGYDVRVAPVDERGVLDVDSLAGLLPSDCRPTLVAVMWVNNETGVIQPVDRVAQICEERRALFHSDAVQALGKIPVRLEDAGIDLLAIAAHKIGGPMGIGALWVRDGVELEPLIYGGAQEGGLRSGTENVAGIVGFAEAASIATAELAAETARLGSLRDSLEQGLVAALPEILVNGRAAPERLPNVLSISLPDIDIEGLLTSLDLEGICVSSGSACTTGSIEPSHVMVAMSREGEMAQNTIRFSLGWSTEPSQIEYVLETFPRLVAGVRDYAARR